MRVRKRSLPLGWYPETASSVLKVLDKWNAEEESKPGGAVAGIAPHAGWDFSGRLAFSVFNSIDREIDTIAVVGGHLPPVDTLVAAYEDSFSTPLGEIRADAETLSMLRDRMNVKEDTYGDNTVEIQLPFVKYLFNGAKLLHLRVSPTQYAIELSRNLDEIARSTGRRLAVVGSTDLTHYGPAYGFSPVGRGERAVEWVRQENDQKIIDAFVRMEHRKALTLSAEDQSACSAGGAVAAASFAESADIKSGKLLGRLMSCDLHKSDSFVGYAGISYLLDTEGG